MSKKKTDQETFARELFKQRITDASGFYFPLCGQCKHYLGIVDDRFICKAFPEGIPGEIMRGDFDHNLPVRGDNDIRFEKREDQDE